MSNPAPDLIDQVLSIIPGSHLDALRRHREVARDNVQQAYLALFEPTDASQVSLLERFAVASFVSGLQGQPVLADHYAHKLTQLDGGPAIAAAINNEVERGATTGPYGIYPAGPLSGENKVGLHFAVSPEVRHLLGERLAAALDHAHLLVFRPRDSSKEALQALLAAGWSTAGIVTLSQLVSYLAFQLRLVEGLSALAGAAAIEPANDTTITSFTAAVAAGSNP
jgi:CMD domain protein